MLNTWKNNAKKSGWNLVVQNTLTKNILIMKLAINPILSSYISFPKKYITATVPADGITTVRNFTIISFNPILNNIPNNNGKNIAFCGFGVYCTLKNQCFAVDR